MDLSRRNAWLDLLRIHLDAWIGTEPVEIPAALAILSWSMKLSTVYAISSVFS
jgi:hypothetical protein